MSSGSSCLELLLTQTLLAIVLLDFFCFQLGNTNALSMKPFITFVTTAVKKKTNCYTISNPFLFAQFKYSIIQEKKLMLAVAANFKEKRQYALTR